MPQYVILTIGAFDYILNKTGNMLLRYMPENVVAVVDPDQAGQTSQDVLGYGGSVPVVNSVEDSLRFKPDTLVIGNAPQGGIITTEYRGEILTAIRNGCDIISGMHRFLGDDPEISQQAGKFQVNLTDLRKPPTPPHFPAGAWKNRDVPVMLTVGSDCDTGKMTAAWEMTVRLRERGWKVNFVGTGQTGILLGGYGVPVDAVVGDFMAGEIEYAVSQASPGMDLVIVEGQGALTNMFYSGVSLGLLHGAMPDFILVAHDPVRTLDVVEYPMPDLETIIPLHLDLMKPFKETRIIGINLLTYMQSEEKARETIRICEEKTGLPSADLVRFGDRGLVDAMEKALRSWK